MKKLLALLLALSMVFALCACGGSTPPANENKPAENSTPVENVAPAEATELTLWTYPIGK